MINHTIRSNLSPGKAVDIVLKKDQPTGELTRGIVKKILSPGNKHPRGIKVMLENGQVGRVQKILTLIYYYSDNKYQKIMTPNELLKFGKITKDDLGIFPDWIICKTSKSNIDSKFEHWVVIDDLEVNKWVIVTDLHNKKGLISSRTNYGNVIIKNSGETTSSLISAVNDNPNKDVLLYINTDLIPIKILTIN